VVDRYAQTPCIRFLGKSDRISNYFGEKLQEDFVAGVLDELFHRHSLTPRFALLAPDDHKSGFAYTLYIELPPDQPPGDLATTLDDLLCRNFHYDYCRRLGQLAAARVVVVAGGADAYLAALHNRGMKLGNIKPAVLDPNPGWDQWFKSATS
jgi:hypothetical protein